MRATSLTAAGPDQAFTLRSADPAWSALTESQLLHNSWTKPRGSDIAIVRTGQPYTKLNTIYYRDTNVPCGTSPTVRWVLGRFSSPDGHPFVYGWLPTTLQSGAGVTDQQRTC